MQAVAAALSYQELLALEALVVVALAVKEELLRLREQQTLVLAAAHVAQMMLGGRVRLAAQASLSCPCQQHSTPEPQPDRQPSQPAAATRSSSLPHLVRIPPKGGTLVALCKGS